MVGGGMGREKKYFHFFPLLGGRGSLGGGLQPGGGFYPARRSVHTSLSSGTEVPRRLKPAPHGLAAPRLRPCAARKCVVILARTLTANFHPMPPVRIDHEYLAIQVQQRIQTGIADLLPTYRCYQ